MQQTIQLAKQCAGYFRLGKNAEGSDNFVRLIDAISTQIDELPQQSTLALLKQMLAAQERGDFLFLADLLEYDFIQLLSGETKH